MNSNKLPTYLKLSKSLMIILVSSFIAQSFAQNKTLEQKINTSTYNRPNTNAYINKNNDNLSSQYYDNQNIRDNGYGNSGTGAPDKRSSLLTKMRRGSNSGYGGNAYKRDAYSSDPYGSVNNSNKNNNPSYIQIEVNDKNSNVKTFENGKAPSNINNQDYGTTNAVINGSGELKTNIVVKRPKEENTVLECDVPEVDMRFSKLRADSRQDRLETSKSYTDTPVDVGKVEVEVATDNQPADGQSENPVEVRVFDKKGQAIRKRTTITVDIDSDAEIRQADSKTGHYGPGSSDLDPNKPGFQANTDCNGLVKFTIIAPTKPVDVNLAIYAGSVEAKGVISYLPHLRDMIAVGLIEGIISKRSISKGSILSISRNDGFEKELTGLSYTSKDGTVKANGRTAFFLKGKLKGETLLTAAYDSDKDTRAALLRDINPYEFYPVYGDSSLVGYEARSSQRLYVRLDNKRNYLLYGDYQTAPGFSEIEGGGKVGGITYRQLGAYNRTATGVRGHLEDKNYAVNVYASRDRLKNKVSEFLMNGTSIVGTVDAKAVENTEKVEMVTYDRNARNRILSVTPLERNKDYIFEAFSGRILLLGLDVNLFDSDSNPRAIRISYELEQDQGDKFLVAGVDAQAKIADAITVGGSFVNDKNPQKPLKIASANVGVSLGKSAQLVVEGAQTITKEFINDGKSTKTATLAAGETSNEIKGKALRAELVAKTDFIDANLYAKKIDRKFDNPDSGAIAGTNEVGAKINIKPVQSVGVYLEGARFQDNSTLDSGPKKTTAAVGVKANVLKGVSVDLSARSYKEDKGLGTNLALPANYGNFSDSTKDSGLPTIVNGQDRDVQTVRLGATYTTEKNSSIEVAVESGKDKNITSNTDNKASRITVGGSLALSEKTKLYARYENQKNLGSALSYTQGNEGKSFNIGLESKYLENGRLYSEYRLRDATSAQDVRTKDIQQAVGLSNTWAIIPGLRGSLNAETLQVLSGNARRSAAVGGGLDYVGSETFKLSTRLQGRRIFDTTNKTADAPGDLTEDQILHTISLSSKLSHGFTLLAKNYHLLNKYRQYADGRVRGNLQNNEFNIGIAYRPVYTNKWNMLLAYGNKSKNDLSDANAESYKVNQLALIVNAHPTRQLWITAKLAGKIREDKLYLQNALSQDWLKYTATLASARVTYDITDKWDVGVMGAVMHNPEYGTRSTAFGLESGYQVAENLWLSAGYNFTGFDDKDLTGSDYTLNGAYLRFRYKFDEDLFESDNPDFNRTIASQ